MAREYRLDREEVTAEAVRLLLEAKKRGYNATRKYVRHELIKFSKSQWRAEQFPVPRGKDGYDGDTVASDGDVSPAYRRILNDSNPGDGFEFEPGELGWYSSGSCVPRPDRKLVYKLPIYRPSTLPEFAWGGEDLRIKRRGTVQIETWIEPCSCLSCLALRKFYEKHLGFPYPLERMTLDPTDPGVMIDKHSRGATYEEIGKDAGITEDAARKRVDHYLDKIDAPSVPPARIPCCVAPPCAALYCWRTNYAPFGIHPRINRLGGGPAVSFYQSDDFKGGKPGRQLVKPHAKIAGDVFTTSKPEGKPGRYICSCGKRRSVGESCCLKCRVSALRVHALLAA